MSQSLAPEPGVEPHAGIETGPCGLSISHRLAVNDIMMHCLEGRMEVLRNSDRLPDGNPFVRESELRGTVGYLYRTLQSILEECKRLT